MTAEPTWRQRAACRGANTEMFFPGQGESTREAKAVCARCPVAAQCLEYAIDAREVHGIWGGRSEQERRAIRRKRRAAAAIERRRAAA